MTIETQIRDPVALATACQRLQLAAPVWGTARLFSTTATGWQVQLRAWRYPVICNTEQGQLHYDHFGGRWGNEAELRRLQQIYAVEKTKLEARKAGQMVTETAVTDGSIRLQIAVA